MGGRAVIKAKRNVLQIRVAARETPRRRRSLMKRSMQTSGQRIDQFGNNVDIRRFELRKLPVFQREPRQFMLRCQLFENLYSCRILSRFPELARPRQIEFVEKNLAQLP